MTIHETMNRAAEIAIIAVSRLEPKKQRIEQNRKKAKRREKKSRLEMT